MRVRNANEERAHAHLSSFVELLEDLTSLVITDGTNFGEMFKQRLAGFRQTVQSEGR